MEYQREKSLCHFEINRNSAKRQRRDRHHLAGEHSQPFECINLKISFIQVLTNKTYHIPFPVYSPIRDFNQYRVVIFLATKQWTITHWSNSLFKAVINNIIKTPKWVQLNLIDSWCRQAGFLHLPQMLNAKVGHSNRSFKKTKKVYIFTLIYPKNNRAGKTQVLREAQHACISPFALSFQRNQRLLAVYLKENIAFPKYKLSKLEVIFLDKRKKQ